MPFDGLVLYKILREAKEHLIGERIRNVYQPVYYQVLLQLSKNYLLFSLQNPSYMLLLTEKPDIPMEPAHFAQFLRKRIRNGRIINIEQLGIDRLGFIEIENFDEERADKVSYKLYFELMGRNSNLILVNEEGNIEESYKHVHDEFRPILPGNKFVPYYDDSKLNILKDDIKVLDDSFLNNLMGFSKKSKDFLKIIGIEKALQDLQKPYLFFFKDNNKFDAVAITPNSFTYEKLSPSEAILKVFQERANQSRFLEIQKYLEKIVNNLIDRSEKTKDLILKDLGEEKLLEELETKGKLLQSYLFKIKKGNKYIPVIDWNTNLEVVIEIDPLLSPTQNLEKYYKEIKRIKNKVEFAKKRIKEVNNELEYLYQLLETITSAQDLETLIEIREEMKEQGLIRETKKPKREKKFETSYRKYEYEGFEMLVGKNNKQNDDLTRSASREDIWLHTHEIPGSHVIIKSAGRDVPEQVIKYAARIAATFSKAKMSSNVAVDYTQRKNVWKPKGAKPGMWLYENYETIIVEPLKDIF